LRHSLGAFVGGSIRRKRCDGVISGRVWAQGSPGASAERVLGELLGRVLVVKDRPGLACGVELMVVFGSYLSEAERLNDMGVAVELEAKRGDDASFALRGRSRMDCPPQKSAAARLRERDGARSSMEYPDLVCQANYLASPDPLKQKQSALRAAALQEGANREICVPRKGGRRQACLPAGRLRPYETKGKERWRPPSSVGTGSGLRYVRQEHFRDLTSGFLHWGGLWRR
jgi:hypothetical protein